MKTDYCYDRKITGHRKSYQDYFENYGYVCTNKLNLKVLFCNKLLLSTCDDYPILSLLIAIIRSVTFRRTRLVFIRLHNYSYKISRRWKLIYALILSKCPFVKIFTIGYDKRLISMCSAIEIIDPAFFYTPKIEFPEAKLRKIARSCLTEIENLPQVGIDNIIFLGAISNARGYGRFLELWKYYPDIKTICIGRNPTGFFAAINYEGFKDWDELANQIPPNSCVWCVFGLEYDNSSGFIWFCIKNKIPFLINSSTKFFNKLLLDENLDLTILPIDNDICLLQSNSYNLSQMTTYNDKILSEK